MIPQRESFNMLGTWVALQNVFPLHENAFFRAMEWRGAMRNAMQYSIAGHPQVKRVELPDGARGVVHPSSGISMLPNVVINGPWQVVGVPII